MSPEAQDTTLADAIGEAQRRAIADQQWEAHQAIHEAEEAALKTALDVAERDRRTHDDSHDREHVLHSEKHASEKEAVGVALSAVSRERSIHAEAHEREHLAHQRVHDLQQIAVGKAEASVEERLKAMNEFRGQLRDQQATFATRDVVETLRAEVDRRFVEMNATMLTHFQSAEKLTQDRYESNRTSITELQKSDVRGEGRSMGQGSIVAYIVTAVGLIGGLLGIVIIVANFATRGPVPT